MRIAQVVLRYPPAIGGGATHVKYISEELSKYNNVTIDIYTSFLIDNINENLSLSKIEKIGNIKIFRYKTVKLLKNRDTLYIQPKMFIDILKNKYDIIHIHGFRYYPFYGGVLASFFTRSTSWIVTLHHNPDLQSTILHKIHDKIFLKFMNRFKKIIALTDYEKNWLISHGIDPEKVAVVPNGLPDTFFENVDKIKTEDIDEFKKKIKINENFILTFIGRISKNKNLRIIIKALAFLPKNIRENIIFVFAGPDYGEVRNLQIFAQKYEMNENIVYLGTISEKEKILLLKSSDVFVMPSTLEAFSIATLEAMACGLPILAAKSGGLISLIKEYYNGFLLNPHDPKEWNEHIMLLYENDKIRYELGMNGRKIAERYRWSCIVKKLIKLYEGVLNENN